MLPIINFKENRYINEIHVELHPIGNDIQTKTVLDENSIEFDNVTETVPAKLDYFPNTDFRDSNLSRIIPAGIDPGQTRIIPVSPLSIGDYTQAALDASAALEINEIIEPEN